MAYPTVSAPYGLQPINLIGGQVFAGATRQLPIPRPRVTVLATLTTTPRSITVMWFS